MNTDIKRIAFLGMGAMGSRMVKHLLDAGHQVKVWNRTAETAKHMVSLGATWAKTPAVAAEGVDMVISMVRDDEASEHIWLHPHTGALNAMEPGTTAIESSTLTTGWVQSLATTCQDKGVMFADAPVAGSRPQAEAAKLIYFVGTSLQVFQQIEPLLKLMGGAVHHTGSVGTGAMIKLAVNALFGSQLATLAELLGLLRKSGMDGAQALTVIASTPVCSPAAQMAGQAMLAGQFAPAFPIQLVEKDLSYLQAAGEQFASKVPVSLATRQVMIQAIEQGFGEDNITGVAQLY